MESELKEDILSVVSNKKFQTIAVIILFLLTLFIGLDIRTQPIKNGNLIDVTTQDYVPLALDPFYFLREAQTILENGKLPEFDPLRDPEANVTWVPEILPYTVVWTYKIMNTFDSSVTFNYANILNPVIFFVLGLIVFFALVWIITKNKWLALISSAILTVIPPYLYRTLAGFSDHESIGMFGFFLALLSFAWGLFYLEKEKLNYTKSSLLGIFAGFSSMLAIAGWGGGAKFLFMILPLAFLLQWFANGKKNNWNQVTFYATFILGILIFIPVFGYDFSRIIQSYFLNTVGLLTFFTLGFTVVELFLRQDKRIPKKIKEKSISFSISIVLFFGLIFYQAFVGNIFSMISHLIQLVLNPFGTGRVTLTVAENAQPYLVDLISQLGKIPFNVFIFGCLLVGFMISRGIEIKKYRNYFFLAFTYFIFGILYSRYSPASIFNGDTFISKLFFFTSFLVFAVVTIYTYLKSNWKIEAKWIFVVAWMIPMLLAVRSAVRVFFTIVPFISMMIPMATYEIYKWGTKQRSKDKKVFALAVFWVLVVFLSISFTFGASLFGKNVTDNPNSNWDTVDLFTSDGYYKTSMLQAKYQTPSYNTDWQNAMAWVRENTPEDSLFLHWWDYGYWVQTGGERTTIVDGGYHADYHVHSIGRYVLTTPYPETAKSYMKSYKADYLLIDPTDLGKYSAYSSIADHKNFSDRASVLATFVSNPAQIQETRNGTTRIYQGGVYLDSDLIYKNGSSEIFLPQGKTVVAGVILELNSLNQATQPQGVYFYNNKRYDLPVRYIYANGKLYDFKTGVEAIAYIYPYLYVSSGIQKVDNYGALIYLSEKTKDSLVAQLYLMNDPNNLYPELELVHEENEYPFEFYYQSYNGPIKIYKINRNEMENILVREEFITPWESTNDSMYGAFDNLEFVKN